MRSLVNRACEALVLLLIIAVPDPVTAETVLFNDDFSTGLGAWNTSAATGTIAWDSTNQWVQITELTNNYANMYRSGGANAVAFVQVDINDVSDAGQAWGPSLALYYDVNNCAWMALRQDGKLGVIVYTNGTPSESLFDRVAGNTWCTLKIELDRDADKLNFYCGPQSGSLTLQTSRALPDTFGGNGYMILGKNGNYGSYSPFLRNSYGDGSTGISRYDNAIFVTATAVPEPSSWLQLACGAVGLLACTWRRRK